MPKDDNDKNADDLFPSKSSGWYWYDQNGVAHRVDLPLSYNPEKLETRYMVSVPDGGVISYNYNKIIADPITGQGDCRNYSKTYNIPTVSITEPKQERYCFFLDIDGTLLKHYGDKPEQFEDEIEVLPAVAEFFALCGKQGHRVILTSGRRESFRKITEKQLRNACISYDELILGCTNAIRVLVNDTKPYRDDSPQTAIAFNLVRNEGVEKLVDFLKK